tara:strand:+ start:241 stop:753 length:513 start_codon:yes stop_codon:yes gene_type:complete
MYTRKRIQKRSYNFITAVFALLFLVNEALAGEDEGVITEKEVRHTIEKMFHAISTENSNKNSFYDIVTSDFTLYEMGQVLNATELIDLIDSTNTIEDDWELSDFNISIDSFSAHAFFKNRGRFITLAKGEKKLTQYEWLESAYLIKENDKLKIKFYFSDATHKSIEKLTQ